MDHREIPKGFHRHWYARGPLGWRRQCRKKCKRQIANRAAELGTVGSIPGVDRIEGFQFRNAGAVNDAYQVEAGVGDSARVIGEAD